MLQYRPYFLMVGEEDDGHLQGDDMWDNTHLTFISTFVRQTHTCYIASLLCPFWKRFYSFFILSHHHSRHTREASFTLFYCHNNTAV